MRYQFFDFAIESDVAFHGLARATAAPGLTLLRENEPHHAQGAAWFHDLVRLDGVVWARVGRAGRDLVLHFPGLATLRAGGGLLHWQRKPATDAAEFRHLLLDQALPLVVAQNGRTILHAACVTFAGRSVLLAGRSGSGKSTLAAASAGRIGGTVGDDTVALVLSGDVVNAYPAYAGVRLWPDTILALNYVGGREVCEGRAKLHFEDSAAPGAGTVGCIYTLEPIERACPRVIDLRGREAVMALVRNTLVLDPYDRARSGQVLADLVAIASRVPVRRLEIPHQFDCLSDAVSQVESGLGLEVAR
jgi:hypothetical protein